ncbi:methyl-accepting chemotaxis protein [Oceanidesulfovibrio marinus]|uniref:HAMP domain-containing protein n=1 Tax=Oceanidesulfovibrio marinus TaxID=370038 RepID=A0ABX6NCJ1_9BACT|nr:HAMP domain-containing methyl-accepting chemotaxis protein [Oceanidesulfovibrio marinus]QJT07899.1 HAMP domain-containing protein [Oceanidesulfovibrio marinus]
MSMSIRVRLILLGIGVVLALSILAGINFINGRSVSGTMKANALSLEKSNLAQHMRENLIHLNLIAMDAIVDRDNGMSDERIAVIQSTAAELRDDLAKLRKLEKDKQLQQNIQALDAEQNKLIEMVSVDLVQFINKSAGVLHRREEQLQALDNRLDGQNMRISAFLDILEDTFTEQRDSSALAGIWERYDTAVTETRAVNLANVKTALVGMQILNDRNTGKDNQAQLAEIRHYGEFLTTSLDTLAGYARSEEAKDSIATLQESIPAFLKVLTTELPDMIQKAYKDRLEILAAFDATVDKVHDHTNAAREALDTILDAENLKLVDSSQSLEDRISRSNSLGVMIYGIVVLAIIVVMIFIIRSIVVPLGKTVEFADGVAAGDLDRDLAVRGKDETGRLADALRRMVDELRDKIRMADAQTQEAEEQSQRAQAAMEQAQEAQKEAEKAKQQGMLEAADRLDAMVGSLTSSSEQLTAQIEQTSHGSARQSERASETATAMEEMNATVLEVARNASEAAESADSARSKAMGGSSVVTDVVTSINDVSTRTSQMKSSLDSLGRRAEDIGAIMTVITDIADQTNLLALNAAIEAARAGEAGRGFAVVADEVRKLAEKTMSATSEVGRAIDAIQQETRGTVESMDEASGAVQLSTEYAEQAGAALQEIVRIVETTSDQVRSIATASEQQSAASEEINRAIEEVNSISAENTQGMYEAEQAVAGLADLASRLARLIDELRQG